MFGFGVELDALKFSWLSKFDNEGYRAYYYGAVWGKNTLNPKPQTLNHKKSTYEVKRDSKYRFRASSICLV